MIKKIILTIAVTITLMGIGRSQEKQNQNAEILNIVWETMNTQYFDSTFNGLNWQKEYDHYKPIITSCKTMDSLYYYLNQMLFKLGVSHLGVVPPGEADLVGDPQLFLDGTLGIDIRYLKGEAIIISVKKNSSAYEAGIKPGFTLIEINGKTIDQIVKKRESEPTPPFNQRNLKSMITQDIIRELYGTPGDTVSLKYLDADNLKHNIKITLKKRSIKKVSLLPGLLKIYASINTRVINNKTGYIRFNVFHPVILDSIVNIIHKYKNLPGIIIDIRGNPGGDFNTRKTIAEQFVTKRTLFWQYLSRNGIRKVFLNPAKEPYTGKLVILADGLSGSSSEEFAGGMQAIGRATIIGQPTAGKVLTMKVVQLPKGGLFVYPDAQTRTANNKVLEGIGVVPDIKVKLNKKDLLKGIDTQLEEAIEFLVNKDENNAIKIKQTNEGNFYKHLKKPELFFLLKKLYF